MKTRMLSAAILASLTIGAGCGGGDDDDSPTAQASAVPVTLQLGTIEPDWAPYRPGLEEFAHQVEDLSGGSLRVDIEWEAIGEWHPGAEAEVAEMVQDDELDLALIPARAFDELGVTSMQALHAPFLVSSDELAGEIARSELATDLMAGLEGTGAVGLALLPESLRHPVGYNQPVDAASDFDGLTIRTPVSDVSYRLMDALGSTPVDEADFHARVAAGELAAVESAFIWSDDLPPGGTFTANITFYPKVNVLTASQAAVERLTDGQREVLYEAAATTLDHVLETNASDAEAAAAFCEAGGSVVLAPEAEIAALETAAGPLYFELEADAQTSANIEQIRAIKSELIPGDDGSPQACGPGSDTAEAAPAEDPAAGAFPQGTYEVELTEDFLLDQGLDPVSASNMRGTNTLTVEDGEWEWTSPAATPPTCQGTYSVDAGRITLAQQGVCGDLPDGAVILIAAWTLDDDQLQFTDIASGLGEDDPWAETFWGSKPWTKVD